MATDQHVLELPLTDAFVLPRDVHLIPVADLPAALLDQFEHQEGDFAVTRPRSRSPSCVVDAETGRFLERLREPQLIIEAIMRQSLEAKADPHEMLESIYPVLERLITGRLLLPVTSADSAEIVPSLHRNERQSGYTVLRCVQVLEDTELYLVRSTAGEPMAMKVLRPTAHPLVRRMVQREARILAQLDGRVNPALMDFWDSEESTCLVTEWCHGVSAATIASEHREVSSDGEKDLWALCCSIIEAYAHLHSQDVLHGDIHPRNILVGEDNRITIIDYGMARSTAEDDSDGLAKYRAGVAFFFEPEYARARLAGTDPPPTTPLGEQYSLGALLHLLLTGVHYADFGLEHDEMLRQILSDPPVAFAARGLRATPGLEPALRRSLEKQPHERFASLHEFLTEVRRACVRPPGPTQTAAKTAPVSHRDALADRFVRRVGLSGDLLAAGVRVAPTASITYGAAGIAVALHRMALRRGDPELLAAADVWATRAMREASTNEGLSNPSIDITERVVGRVTPFHTITGIHVAQALVGHALGDDVSHSDAIERFCRASSAPCRSIDLTLGRAGTTLGSALLLETAPTDGNLLELGDSTMREIWDQIGGFRPIAECTEIEYLGIAHGWAGILYATLRWCAVTRARVPDGVERRLAELSDLSEPTGRGVRWPVLSPAVNGTGSDSMPGWCNGSAGYVHLWTLATDVLRDEAYITLAVRAGWHAWEERHSVGQLCCGLAGQAYALLNLHRYTHERSWLERATHLAQRAATAPGMTRFPASLYKGEAGVAVLEADLDAPGDAAMPFFEPGGLPGGH